MSNTQSTIKRNRHHAVWPPGCPYSLPAVEMSVYEQLQKSAEQRPDQAAIIYYNTVITYGELLTDINRLAAFLQGPAAVKPDDRVVVKDTLNQLRLRGRGHLGGNVRTTS